MIVYYLQAIYYFYKLSTYHSSVVYLLVANVSYRVISLYLFRYGWSRARYVYSLISGVGIFFLGAGVTVYHGVAGLINPAPLENLVMVNF